MCLTKTKNKNDSIRLNFTYFFKFMKREFANLVKYAFFSFEEINSNQKKTTKK